MISISEIRLYQILKERFGEKEAGELVYFISSEVKNEFDSRREVFATKVDLSDVKSELMRSIYIVGLIQFLAITGAVIGIVNFLIK